MKNNYNTLVAVLMVVCLLDAGYRLYRVYHKLTNKQQESHYVK